MTIPELRQTCWALIGAVLTEDEDGLAVLVDDLAGLGRDDLVAMVEAMARSLANNLQERAPSLDNLVGRVRYLAIAAAVEAGQ